MDTLVLNGFIIGLASNLHCLGMCGPISLAIPLDRSSKWSVFSGILQYNFGRILTYFLIGLIISQLGVTASTFGILQKLSIITGLGLIFFAWRHYLPLRPAFQFNSKNSFSFLSKSMGSILRWKNSFRPFLLGMLNGLLPCGMVFTALINTFLSENPMSMVTFGIGTLPAMLLVGFAANKINPAFRQKLNRFVPVLLTIVGSIIILRGLNLDIPYLSPKVTISTNQTNTNQVKVEMSCCHKNSGTTCKP